jgi:hypothetical protein
MLCLTERKGLMIVAVINIAIESNSTSVWLDRSAMRTDIEQNGKDQSPQPPSLDAIAVDVRKSEDDGRNGHTDEAHERPEPPLEACCQKAKDPSAN